MKRFPKLDEKENEKKSVCLFGVSIAPSLLSFFPPPATFFLSARQVQVPFPAIKKQRRGGSRGWHFLCRCLCSASAPCSEELRRPMYTFIEHDDVEQRKMAIHIIKALCVQRVKHIKKKRDPCLTLTSTSTLTNKKKRTRTRRGQSPAKEGGGDTHKT